MGLKKEMMSLPNAREFTRRVYTHLVRYFGSPFGRYPTFHTLTSVGGRKLVSMLKTW